MGPPVTAPGPDSFFDPPNDIELASLPASLQDLLRRLALRAQTGHRSLLPGRTSQRTRWYGFAPDTRDARILWEELRSWLGPPVAERISHLVTASDVLDSRALALFKGWHVITVDVAVGWERVASEHVGDLCNLWALAPERSVDMPRPVGRVLRQFYDALLAGSRHDAESALEELGARALLNPTNLRFLRVEMLRALGLLQELRDDQRLRGLTLLARPPAVTQHLAQAANALYIEPALREEKPDWQHVADLVDSAWPNLAIEPHHVTDLSTARCFALAHRDAPVAHSALLSELTTRHPGDPVLAAVIDPLALEKVTTPEAPASPLALYELGSYDLALHAAEQLPSTRAVATVALACAVNLASASAAARALAVYQSLPRDVRDAMQGNAVEAAFVAQLDALTAQQTLPSGWLDWLRGDWPDRPDLLAEWSRAWSSPATLGGGPSVALEVLDALHDARRDRVRNGLPVLIEAILSAPLEPARVTLMVVLCDVLLSSEPGRLERQAATVLIDECLSQGCDRSEYRDLLTAIERQMPHLGPREATWLLQVLDLMLLHGAPDPAQQAALVGVVYALLLNWSDRLDPVDRALSAKLIGVALGDAQALALNVDPADPVASGRVPASVGIYSLMEGASAQAAKWIKETWPGTEVRVSSAHVSTEALNALVRGVDVMLVQTSHAKHAATHAVEAAATDSAKVLRVAGRGATSLFRALLAWSEDDQPGSP